MDIETFRSFFMWCSVLNGALLVISFGATGFVVAEKEAFALCVAVTNPNQVLSLIEL